MDDAESRFLHLLQPIRDLTKNWEVDVAAQLGEYLEEVRTRGGAARRGGVGVAARGEPAGPGRASVPLLPAAASSPCSSFPRSWTRSASPSTAAGPP